MDGEVLGELRTCAHSPPPTKVPPWGIADLEPEASEKQATRSKALSESLGLCNKRPL